MSQPDALGPRPLRRVVGILCLTQIVSWGVLYYAFPVLAPTIARSTGWSPSAVTAAFSAGLVASAVAGVFVGRRLDQVGPRPVMTAGSALAVPSVVAISLAPSYPAFFVSWIVAGISMAAVLYPPAFAALTRWGGPQRVRALTTLTLVAGLASTVFAPLTAGLDTWLGWRHTYLALAAVLAVVTIPGHWLGLRPRWTPASASRSSDTTGVTAGQRASTRPFLVLVVAMAVVAICVYAVVINLVPLLRERGLSTGSAALALGLGGVGQVCGRLGYARLAARTGVAARSAAVFVTVALTTGLLAVVSGPMLVLLGLSVLVGVGRGVFTLIQATAVSDRWGTEGYGRLNGILAAPIMLATASGPWLGSALAEVLGSQSRAFIGLAALAVLAALLTPATIPRPPGSRS